MTLFQKNINSDLLIAIEYTNILFACNYGAETVVYDLANKKFGSVTDATKGIINNVKSGKTMQDALLFEKTAWKNRNMQSFISALSSSSTMDISRRLTDLGKHIIAEKKLYVDNFIDNLKAKLGKFIILMAVPLLVYFLIELSTETFTELIGALSPGLKQAIYIITLIISAAVIFVMLAALRYKE